MSRCLIGQLLEVFQPTQTSCHFSSCTYLELEYACTCAWDPHIHIYICIYITETDIKLLSLNMEVPRSLHLQGATSSTPYMHRLTIAHQLLYSIGPIHDINYARGENYYPQDSEVYFLIYLEDLMWHSYNTRKNEWIIIMLVVPRNILYSHSRHYICRPWITL